MLQVQEETVYGGCEEAISGDAHVSVCRLVDILGNSLEALKKAVSTGDDIFKCNIARVCVLKLLSKVDENNSNESNQCDDEGSHSNGSLMLPANLDGCHNITLFHFVTTCFVSKIVCGSSAHDNEVRAVFEECCEPKHNENSKP